MLSDAAAGISAKERPLRTLENLDSFNIVEGAGRLKRTYEQNAIHIHRDIGLITRCRDRCTDTAYIRAPIQATDEFQGRNGGRQVIRASDPPGAQGVSRECTDADRNVLCSLSPLLRRNDNFHQRAFRRRRNPARRPGRPQGGNPGLVQRQLEGVPLALHHHGVVRQVGRLHHERVAALVQPRPNAGLLHRIVNAEAGSVGRRHDAPQLERQVFADAVRTRGGAGGKKGGSLGDLRPDARPPEQPQARGSGIKQERTEQKGHGGERRHHARRV